MTIAPNLEYAIDAMCIECYAPMRDRKKTNSKVGTPVAEMAFTRRAISEKNTAATSISVRPK